MSFISAGRRSSVSLLWSHDYPSDVEKADAAAMAELFLQTRTEIVCLRVGEEGKDFMQSSLVF